VRALQRGRPRDEQARHRDEHGQEPLHRAGEAPRRDRTVGLGAEAGVQRAASPAPPSGAGYRWVVLAVGTAAQTAFLSVFLGVAVIAPALRERYDLSLSGTGVII